MSPWTKIGAGSTEGQRALVKHSKGHLGGLKLNVIKSPSKCLDVNNLAHLRKKVSLEKVSDFPTTGA